MEEKARQGKVRKTGMGSEGWGTSEQGNGGGGWAMVGQGRLSRAREWMVRNGRDMQ